MTQESTSKVKMKVSKKRIFAILIVLAVPVVAFLFVTYFPWPIKSWSYQGMPVSFRADLRSAQKIPILTSLSNAQDPDSIVRNALVRDDVTNITFLFKPTSDQGNALYIVERYEIIKALTFAYLYSPTTELHQIPTFDTQAVDSYSNITATQFNLKIVLVHPDFGNDTVVSNDGYIVYVEAKNMSSFDSEKTQFDLATVRLMMAILSIKIQ